MTDKPFIVAQIFSKRGGRCGRPDCRKRIRAGETVVKVDTGQRGRQTNHGNGLGQWWCVNCARTCAQPKPPAAPKVEEPKPEQLGLF